MWSHKGANAQAVCCHELSSQRIGYEPTCVLHTKLYKHPYWRWAQKSLPPETSYWTTTWSAMVRQALFCAVPRRQALGQRGRQVDLHLDFLETGGTCLAAVCRKHDSENAILRIHLHDIGIDIRPKKCLVFLHTLLVGPQAKGRLW